MKNVLAILALFLITVSPRAASDPNLAQKSDDDRRLARGSFYLGTSLKASSLAAESAKWLNVQAGIAFSKYFAVGGAFSTLASTNTAPDLGPGPDVAAPVTTIAYAGAVLTYTRPSQSDFHTSVDLLVGDGWLGLAPAGYGGWTPGGSDQRDRFLVVEPTLNLQIDLSRRFHAVAGVGYLYTSGIGSPRGFDLEWQAPGWGYTDDNVSSLTTSIGLKLSAP